MPLLWMQNSSLKKRSSATQRAVRKSSRVTELTKLHNTYSPKKCTYSDHDADVRCVMNKSLYVAAVSVNIPDYTRSAQVWHTFREKRTTSFARMEILETEKAQINSGVNSELHCPESVLYFCGFSWWTQTLALTECGEMWPHSSLSRWITSHDVIVYFFEYIIDVQNLTNWRLVL